MPTRTRLAAALSLLLAAGCSANVATPPALPGAVPQAEIARRKPVPVRFRFKLHRAARHAHYLSPATQSLRVSAFDATHQTMLASVTVGTAPGAGSCSSVTNGSFTCSLSIGAPVGNDTFDADAFDAPSGGGQKLSAVSNFAFAVRAGKQNDIAMTLGGIPVSLDVALAGNSVLANGTAATGFAFGGIGPGARQPVQLTAKDADGYTIVGAGVPAFALSS